MYCCFSPHNDECWSCCYGAGRTALLLQVDLVPYDMPQVLCHVSCVSAVRCVQIVQLYNWSSRYVDILVLFQQLIAAVVSTCLTLLYACRGVGARALSNGINSAVFFCFFEALRATFAKKKEQVRSIQFQFAMAQSCSSCCRCCYDNSALSSSATSNCCMLPVDLAAHKMNIVVHCIVVTVCCLYRHTGGQLQQADLQARPLC